MYLKLNTRLIDLGKTQNKLEIEFTASTSSITTSTPKLVESHSESNVIKNKSIILEIISIKIFFIFQVKIK